jgi:hypothetical protein
MFSKMNSGMAASNWRLATNSRGGEGRTASEGVGSKRTGERNTAGLNKSFREDEEEYD